MDATQLHGEIRSLLAQRYIDDQQIQAAEKAAFLTMAHYLDLPAAEMTGSFTTTSGTPYYEITSATLDPAAATVDRITSAVWNGTAMKVLQEIQMREWMHSYYGLASSSRTGTPSAMTIYKDRFYLVKAPSETGTVYFTAQMVLDDVTDFPDSYFPLMVELTKMHLIGTAKDADSGTAIAEAGQAWLRAKGMIKSFKDRLWIKRPVVEMSTHRQGRVQGLNEL